MDGRIARLRQRFRTWRNVRRMQAALAEYERRDWEDRHWRKHLSDGVCIDPMLHGMDVDNPAAFVQKHGGLEFRPFHGERPSMPDLRRDRG